MKLSYRPEIDGLRAISVILVILYHLKIKLQNQILFEFGYLGVDIFFVISGYLIFKIVYLDIKKGKFNYLIFLYKRFRRILPVLLISIIVFKFLIFDHLLIEEKNDFLNETIFSSLFISNFYYYINGIEYGQLEQFFKHTWSLAVEEQFYLFIPVITLSLIFISTSYFFLFTTLSIATLISLLISNYYPDYNFVFFITLTRVWELLLGVLVFLVEIKFKKKIHTKLPSKFRSNLSLIFFMLAIYYIFFIANISHHPSVSTFAFLVIICLILLIIGKDCILYNVLSLMPIRFIGLISYSIYIWHFPILIMIYNNIISVSFAEYLIITFSLSVFSYHFIEIIFRRGISNNLFIVLISIIIGFFIIDTYKFKKDTLDQSVIKDIDGKSFNIKSNYNLMDQKGYNCLTEVIKCEFKNNHSKKIIIIGDSLISTNLKYFYNLAKDKFDITTYTNNGCLLVKDVEHTFGNTDNERKCDSNIDEQIRKEIINEKQRYEDIFVIYFGRYQLYSNGYHFKNYMDAGHDGRASQTFLALNDLDIKNHFNFGLSNQLDFFEKNLIKTILIYPLPEMGFNAFKEILLKEENMNFENDKGFYESLEKLNLNVKYSNFIIRSKDIFEIFNNYRNNNYFHFIYPHEMMCNKTKDLCYAHDDKNLFYADESHLSNYGAVILFDNIYETLKNIDIVK